MAHKGFWIGMLAALLVFLSAGAGTAGATFPGQNGKIAFVRGGDVWTMNPDGSGQTNLTGASTSSGGLIPSWSPDGEKLLYLYGTFNTMNPDGSGKRAVLEPDTDGRFEGVFSPDGKELLTVYAYTVDEESCGSEVCARDHQTSAEAVKGPVPADGEGPVRLQEQITDDSAQEYHLDWGPRPASAPQEDATDPTITRTRPAPGSETRDRTPAIKAVVRDETDELAKSDITLRVDGQTKRFSYDADTDRLSRATNKLSLGRHTVKVEATDGAGNEQTEQWSFRVVKRG